MRKTFEFYSDAGHGWLKVDKRDILALSIQDKISGFSYKNGCNIYLEEDSDADCFLTSYKQAYGFEPTINRHTSNKRSRIRNYPSYNGVKE